MVSNNSHAGAPTNVINSEQSAITFFGPDSSSQTSQEFTVDQFPFYFSAYNLGADDVITVQQIVSHGGTKLASSYKPVYGPLLMDTNRSKIVIEHPGRYQLVHSGSGSLGTFTVLGGAASSASSGFAELAAALQAVIALTGLTVQVVTPLDISGSGTPADPYIISIPNAAIPGSGGATATGLDSIAIGNHADCGSAVHNTLVGSSTGIGNVGGSVTRSVLVGYDSGFQTISTDCVFVGNETGVSGGSGVSTYTRVTAIGSGAGEETGGAPTKLDATYVGYKAGLTSVSGTFIGSKAGYNTAFTNCIVINNPSGNALVPSQNDQIVIGDGTTTQMVTAGSIIQGGIISASDSRLKTKVEAEWEALNNINQLNPVTFNWDRDAVKKFDAVVDRTQLDAIQHGLIAQEVEQIFPEFVSEIDRGGGAYKVVRYEKLIPVLIAAIQELSQRVTDLEGKANVK